MIEISECVSIIWTIIMRKCKWRSNQTILELISYHVPNDRWSLEHECLDLLVDD